jgi:hypothetical protein
MKGLTFSSDGALAWSGTAPVTYPAAFGCWVNTNALPSATDVLIMGLSNVNGNNTSNYLCFGFSNDSRMTWRIANATGWQESKHFQPDGSPANNTWRLFVVNWFTELDIRLCYPSWMNSASDTDVDMTGMVFDRVFIGGRYTPSGTVRLYCNATIAEPFVYNGTNLTLQDIDKIVNGLSPLSLRPEKLVFYVPDLVAGLPPRSWFKHGSKLATGVAPTVPVVDTPRLNFQDML